MRTNGLHVLAVEQAICDRPMGKQCALFIFVEQTITFIRVTGQEY